MWISNKKYKQWKKDRIELIELKSEILNQLKLVENQRATNDRINTRITNIKKKNAEITKSLELREQTLDTNEQLVIERTNKLDNIMCNMSACFSIDVNDLELTFGSVDLINPINEPDHKWTRKRIRDIIIHNQYNMDTLNDISKKLRKRLPHKRTMTEFKRSQIRKLYKNKCALCGKRCNNGDIIPHEVDHIIPFKLTGDDRYENLQLLCRSCNREKYDKLLNKDIIKKLKQLNYEKVGH